MEEAALTESRRTRAWRHGCGPVPATNAGALDGLVASHALRHAEKDELVDLVVEDVHPVLRMREGSADVVPAAHARPHARAVRDGLAENVAPRHTASDDLAEVDVIVQPEVDLDRVPLLVVDVLSLYRHILLNVVLEFDGGGGQFLVHR